MIFSASKFSNATIGIKTVLILASEIGTDLSRFPDEANFCSWLNVAPPTCISGGKRLHGHKPHVFNRAGQALRQAALNARNSQSFIGASQWGTFSENGWCECHTSAPSSLHIILEHDALSGNKSRALILKKPPLFSQS